MSKTDAYLQFPLCALSFGKTENERLNAILDYAVVEAGLKLWQKVVPELQKRLIFQWGIHKKHPTGFRREIPLHCAALYGAVTLSVEYAGIQYMLDGHRRLKDYIAEFESRHGRDPLVRIKKQWFFKARDHRGLTRRELAVLCAIYSCIGNKQAAQVTQPRIRRCALGYRTARIMEAEIAARADGASPLTERQLRDTIRRLHRNNFFARCTYARRITYYSNRLGDGQLRKYIVDRYSYASIHLAGQAAKDQDLTAAIRRAKLHEP